MATRLPPEVRAYFSKIGKKGAAKGGHARAAKLTDEQRSESARRAVLARWAKAKRRSPGKRRATPPEAASAA